MIAVLFSSNIPRWQQQEYTTGVFYCLFARVLGFITFPSIGRRINVLQFTFSVYMFLASLCISLNNPSSSKTEVLNWGEKINLEGIIFYRLKQLRGIIARLFLSVSLFIRAFLQSFFLPFTAQEIGKWIKVCDLKSAVLLLLSVFISQETALNRLQSGQTYFRDLYSNHYLEGNQP